MLKFCVVALKRWSLAVVIATGLAACGEEKAQLPSLLPAEKMVQVLIDMHLAESQVSSLVSTQDSAYFLNKAFEKKVFEKHHIDSTAYYRSYAYYLDNVAEFERIYGIVVDSLVYRESTHNLGKPIVSVKKEKNKTTLPRVDSTGLELRKHLRKKLLLNRQEF